MDILKVYEKKIDEFIEEQQKRCDDVWEGVRRAGLELAELESQIKTAKQELETLALKKNSSSSFDDQMQDIMGLLQSIKNGKGL